MLEFGVECSRLRMMFKIESGDWGCFYECCVWYLVPRETGFGAFGWDTVVSRIEVRIDTLLL